MSSAKKGVAVERVEEPTTASFHFRQKGKVQPVGYTGLAIDSDVTVVLKGKVRRIGPGTWEPEDKAFDIEISSCEITSPAKTPVSIDDAVKDADKTRRKVA